MNSQPSEQRFTKYFDTLVALVTHLSSTAYKSRTPTNIASALGLDGNEVREVLRMFPGFFRRSKNEGAEGEHFYTVHLRYARRSVDGETSRPLTPEELSALLNLITHMTTQEHEASLLYVEMKEGHKGIKQTTKITLIVAIISALSAFAAAVITVIFAKK